MELSFIYLSIITHKILMTKEKEVREKYHVKKMYPYWILNVVPKKIEGALGLI